MYVEAYVDEKELLDKFSDEELMKELEDRDCEFAGTIVSSANLHRFHEIWRYKGEDAVLQHLKFLINERIGKVI